MAKAYNKTPQQYDWLVKVIILGDSGVGKTNILTQYCEGKYSGNYMATIGVDFKIKTLQVEDKKIKLQVWDTAGQERFRNITQTYYKGAYGIIFVYSITDRKSFENVENWIKSIKENIADDVCSLIVGNKCDAEVDRRVDAAEGRNLAQKYRMDFIESSAKDGTNIIKIFETLGKDLLIRLKSEPQPQIVSPNNPNHQLKAETHVTQQYEEDGPKKSCAC